MRPQTYKTKERGHPFLSWEENDKFRLCRILKKFFFGTTSMLHAASSNCWSHHNVLPVSEVLTLIYATRKNIDKNENWIVVTIWKGTVLYQLCVESIIVCAYRNEGSVGSKFGLGN